MLSSIRKNLTSIRRSADDEDPRTFSPSKKAVLVAAVMLSGIL